MRQNSLSRRTFFHLSAASVGVLSLGACGANTSSESAENTATRTIKDVTQADVTVPENPRKVVVLSEPTLDAALALGASLVGTVSGRGQSTVPNYLAEKAKDLEILGSVSELDYEKIGAAEPDLILVDGTSVNNRPDVLEVLRHIAPVVYCGYAGGPWRLNFENVANALNKTEQAKKIEAEYDSAVKSLAAQLAPKYAEETFSIVRWQGSGPSLILKELPAGQALADLGLKRPASQDRLGRGHSEPVSLENMASIDADYMFLGTLGGASQDNQTSTGSADVAGAQAALDKAKGTSGFTDLESYKQNHILLVDGSKWTSTGGPLLMRGIVDDVQKALLN